LLAQAQSDVDKQKIEKQMESDVELAKILHQLQEADKEDIVHEERERRQAARKSRVEMDLDAMDTDDAGVSHHHHHHTHTHPFNSTLSGTTRVSRYQKGKNHLDFTGARDSEWQWHQLDHMQVRTSLQTDNHANTPPLIFYRPDALPATQPTVSKH